MNSISRDEAVNAKHAEVANLHRDNAAELVMRFVQTVINSLLRVFLRARRMFAVK